MKTSDLLLLAAATLWMVCVPAAAFATSDGPADAPDSNSGEGVTEPLDLADPVAPIAPVSAAAPVAPKPPRSAGNKFAMTDKAVLDGTYDDVFVLAERVTISGTVLDQAYVTASEITVTGPIGGDAYFAGARVVVESAIGGDLYVSGAEVLVAKGASIGGRILGGVAELTIDGSVAGNVEAGAGKLILRGSVGGDLDVEVGELIIEQGASIAGDLDYSSTSEVALPDGASVGGDTRYTAKVEEVHEDSFEGGTFFRIWDLLAGLILGAGLLWVGGRHTMTAVEHAQERTSHHLGLGVGLVLAVPVTAVVVGLFVIPLPLSAVLLTLLGLGLIFGRLVAAVALGRYLMIRGGKPDPGPYAALALGLLVLVMLGFVPVLGFFVGFGATLVGLGALFATARAGRA